MRVLPHFIKISRPEFIGQKELNETNTNVGLRPIKTREMKMPKLLQQVLFATGLAILSEPVLAHSFGRLYTLPVPFWLYLYGAAATLLVSFLLIGLLATHTRPNAYRSYPAPWLTQLAKSTKPLLIVLTLALFFLCIATGLWGTKTRIAISI